MNTKAAVVGVGIIASLVAIGGGLAFWKYSSIQKAASQGGGFDPMESVEITTVRNAPWQPTASLVGTVFPVRSITINNEVAGVIKEIRFESDMVVNEGDVLVVLDSDTETANLAAAEAHARVMEANIRVQDASVALWELNVRRLSSAMESRAVAASELDNAQSQLATNRAQLDRSKAEFDQAKAQIQQVKTVLDKTVLRAPFKARTALRNIHPGQYVAEGSTIVTLQGVTDNIYLDFAIPQEHAHRVKRGETVMASSTVLGDKPVPVEVVAMDATADRSTRNIRVRTSVPNQDGRLRPGMFVDITVPVGPEQRFSVVPATAVRRASFGDHVFVIVPGEKPGTSVAKQRFVKVGPAIGADVVIYDGLKPDERIAAAGSAKLRDGVGVMVGPPPGAPSSPSAAAEPAKTN